jgi:endo-1,4-beta-mannosidase
MWQRFDAGEIHEDFARIAGLGLDTVRVFLRWDDFMPERARTDPALLERFVQLVGLARDAGLRIMPVLLGAEVAGVPFLPDWARDARAPQQAGNIYTGALLDAQVRYAGDVAAAAGREPAIAAWDLAHRFTAMRAPRGGKLRTGGHETAPASEAEITAWALALKRAVTAHSPRPVTLGTASDDLTVDRNVRLGALGAALDFASIQGASIALPFARSRLDPEAVPFLAFVAASFAFRPVLVSAIGVPSCGPHKLSLFEHLPAFDELPFEPIATDDPLFEPYACLTEDEHAAYARATLDHLHADGRLGALWWCWSDYPPETPLAPVAERAPFVRACGIIRADGSEKPIAAVLSALAREERTIVPTHDMPMISAEYFYRTLPESMRTLYDAFMLHVQANRLTPRADSG